MSKVWESTVNFLLISHPIFNLLGNPVGSTFKFNLKMTTYHHPTNISGLKAILCHLYYCSSLLTSLPFLLLDLYSPFVCVCVCVHSTYHHQRSIKLNDLFCFLPVECKFHEVREFCFAVRLHVSMQHNRKDINSFWCVS